MLASQVTSYLFVCHDQSCIVINGEQQDGSARKGAIQALL